MKKTTRTEVDFSEIFAYAEEKFNIDWNHANDMFFNHSLTYKSYDAYDLGEPLECIPENTPYGELSEHDKGYYILNQFMVDNNLEEIFVKNT